MSSISRGKRSSGKLKTMGNDDEFLSRITKSLYYSKLPMTDRLSLPVTEFAAELFSEVKSGCTLERLDVEEASRISRNACVSPCSFVLALLYLERLKDCNPEYLYKVAPSELFLVSLMIASKFLNDDGEEDEVFNTEWANSADLPLPHMNRLEKEFLSAINWRIFVDNQDFWERLNKLEKDIAYKEGKKRGWFSYHELSQLIEGIRVTALVQALVSISSICLATYTAGVVTLLGSALIATSIPGISLAPKNQSLSFNLSANHILSATDEKLGDEFDEAFGNSSTFNCSSDSEAEDDWQWWMAPVTDWVNYDERRDIGGQNNFVPCFVTNSQVLSGNHRIFDNFITEINWKETINDHLDARNDWKYYVDFVTKISIGY